MNRNDLLIQHLRTLATKVKSIDEDGLSAVSEEERKAAQYIADNFGLEGDVTEVGQRTDRKPEAQDTLRHADIARSGVGHNEDDEEDKVEKPTSHRIGDSTYLPELGVWGFSHHHTADWERTAKQKHLTYSTDRSGYRDCFAISEDEILNMATSIREQRRLSEVTKNIKAGKPIDGEYDHHPGTDAVKHDDKRIHPYENWSEVDRSQSSICLTMPSGTRYLNGSMAQHQHYVAIEIKNPDGRTVCEVAMSPDQFASFLVGRSMVPCTLDHYYSVNQDSVAMRERVYSPESVLDRMRQRLRDSVAEQDSDFAKVIEGLAEHAATGKPMSKTKLEEVIKSLRHVKVRRAENASFVVEQAVEEGSSLAESAMVRVMLAQMTGNTHEAVKGIATSFKQSLLGHKPKDE